MSILPLPPNVANSVVEIAGPGIDVNAPLSNLTPTQFNLLYTNINKIAPGTIPQETLRTIFSGDPQKALSDLTPAQFLTMTNTAQLFAQTPAGKLLNELDPTLLNGFSLSNLTLDRIGARVTTQLMKKLGSFIDTKLAHIARLQMITRKLTQLQGQANQVKTLVERYQRLQQQRAKALKGNDL